jgi:hypothetical protein
MLGTPDSPGLVGGGLLLLGLVVAAVVAIVVWRRRPGTLVDAALLGCLALTLGAGPFLVWRVVEDVRVTTELDAYTRRNAGPIQAYLQPYLLDEAARIVPPGATYATAVGAAVPYEPARKAFPSLALRRLFPRVSVGDPRRADWIVAWGVDPRRLAPVGRVVVARPASGPYPAVRVAEVRR